MIKRIVVVVAHPEDVAWAIGGTLAKYAKTGANIDILCATHGGRGQKELEAAGTILGCSSLTFFEYKQGALPAVNPGELEDIIFRKLVELTPNCIITFETSGINNDPDHMKTTVATTVAFQKYAVSAVHVLEKGIGPLNPPRHARDVWQISFAQTIANEEDTKLYYACMPESVAQYLKSQKIIADESFDKPLRGTPDKKVTTVIDIARFRATKTKAMQAHMSEKEEVETLLSLPNNPLLRQEFFYLRMQGTTEVFMGKEDRVSNRL